MAFHRSIIGKWRLHSLNRYTQKIQRRKCSLLFKHLISIAACQCNDNPSHNICFSTIKKTSTLIACGHVRACVSEHVNSQNAKLKSSFGFISNISNCHNGVELIIWVQTAKMWNANLCQILNGFCATIMNSMNECNILHSVCLWMHCVFCRRCVCNGKCITMVV